ncbi:MAG: efflux RND transporter periplasmic adaptor subunit [Anaerolineae bacterium]|nr:efflux RND transporter periplasmic adaptor subunit [Anaerolineae bacterium]
MRKRSVLTRVLICLGAVALLFARYGPDLGLRRTSPPMPALPGANQGLYSGTIQAEEVLLSAEYGGRVAEVTVDEGDRVRQGQVLVCLDTSLLDDQIAVAEAQLAVAEAALQRLQAGTRPTAIAVAEAQVAQAEAARDAARQALADARALRNEPQDLMLQVAVARAQLAAAEARVRQAVTLRDAAGVGVDEQGNPLQLTYSQPPLPPLAFSAEPAPYLYWQAWAALNGAVAARDGARDQLAQLEAQLAAPQTLVAQERAAESALAQAEAGVEAARAQLAVRSAKPGEEQVAAARARVAQAEAALEALRLQRQRMALATPLDGLVLARQVSPGEVVAPGAPLLTLGRLQEVVLVLYVPEGELARVRLGQRVLVSVDSYPGRTFAGEVVHIADEAEFTPRNVATQEERVNTFFAVRVRLPNPDGALKPGMPADAVFEEEAQ